MRLSFYLFKYLFFGQWIDIIIGIQYKHRKLSMFYSLMRKSNSAGQAIKGGWKAPYPPSPVRAVEEDKLLCWQMYAILQWHLCLASWRSCIWTHVSEENSTTVNVELEHRAWAFVFKPTRRTVWLAGCACACDCECDCDCGRACVRACVVVVCNV